MVSKELETDSYIDRLDMLNEDNLLGNGATIVLEFNPSEYLLSPLAHLIEQNNARLLHVFSYLENEKQIVILKTDAEEASSIIRSLERFDYKVIDYRQKQMLSDETMQNRLNELIYYLEI
ncbi:MAG: hypothetical protein LBG77_06830, partial [Dysgonamonadaceae bacterium]|jgi:hypothetical protein|nr:hypothetical protein [Dysgonamonadaceae bacterium]